MSESGRAPRLSVVVASVTKQSEDILNRSLLTLLAQAERQGCEIILADGTQAGIRLPEALRRPALRSLRLPGRHIFELRALGTRAAKAPIVAWIEDHCLPAKDWCALILEIFASDPHILALGGAVRNGTPETAIDRANYFHNFAAVAEPLQPERYRGVPTIANLAFRSDCLPISGVEPGWIEYKLLPRLCGDSRLRFDHRLHTTHFQSYTLGRTLANHLHNGRTLGAFLSAESGVVSKLRAATGALTTNPWRSFSRIRRILSHENGGARLETGVQGLVILICVAHGIGLTLGHLSGAGQSPHRLQ